MLATAANIKLAHFPYRGSGLSLNDVAGGQIPVVISSLVAAMPLVKAGKVRALAVTSKNRWPITPDIPAASESCLPGFEHITRSEEHTSELQSLMRISNAVLCLPTKIHQTIESHHDN